MDSIADVDVDVLAPSANTLGPQPLQPGQVRRPDLSIGRWDADIDVAAPFLSRHLGPNAAEVSAMLERLGYSSLDALMDAAVPAGIRTPKPLDLPAALSEMEVAEELLSLAGYNRPGESMIGLGYHATITPPVVRRNVLEDPSWYTAYTPYQPEISQGRLEALLNFQTMISDLTGLPTSGSSLLDEGTAAAEALALVYRVRRNATGTFVIDQDALPQTIDVVRTRARAIGIEVVVADLSSGLPDGDLAGVLIQYPGTSGRIPDPRPLTKAIHERGGLAVVAADLLALTLLEAPGLLGADVVVGSSQRFGGPLFYGGPHAGFMSVRDGLERQLPGRLVGVSIDAEGRTAYRLALQTREQHIRRDKATSNICTAAVLLAVTASMYAVYHGPEGLRQIAARTHRHAAEIAGALTEAGYPPAHVQFFDTLTVPVPGRAVEVVRAARDRGVHLRLVDADTVSLSTSECTTDATVSAVLAAFGIDGIDGARAHRHTADALPGELRRRTDFLGHEVFNSHHNETSMLRYVQRLSRRDYALDRGMIPLGSCTMKLTATTAIEPITMPGFADIHPFVPAEDAFGYRELVSQLEAWLAEVTGYDRVSIQPNAGAQGEYAGMLAIRAYHRENARTSGIPDIRRVCLIPSSAHGTNPASAVMAGMSVVVVKARDDGTVDLDDLQVKCEQYADTLAAIMVTYPSTHGVYEETITDLCEIVHAHGGQVYLDGANFNALTGYAKPGELGGDVSHLNLHKTFSLPHGGGGPGVGPVAVRAHLTPYLPSHPLHPDEAKRVGVGAISASPYGSPGVLPIAWAYVRMMGAEGLARATAVAVLSANYVADRLGEHYPVLFRGASGLVAHECILDLREITKRTGVTVDDVAKRLVDYGFHAPTTSFPVVGTLMVEPTESEDLAELDRFCDAMVSIKGEIDRVASGEWQVDDSPLRRAPHTARALVGEWRRAYSREEAVYPAGVSQDKYWPPVARIHHAYGDRNLVCSCQPVDTYAE